MATIDEVKKIVRSLLVSAPLKVTVFTLNKDYKELEGYYIPFKELGYNSLLHFLHSIPDVLRVNGTSPHSEVSLVVSEKIAHVNNLVMKQRKPTKGKKALIPKKSVVFNPTFSINTSTHYKRNTDFNTNNKEKPLQIGPTIPKSLLPFPRPLLFTPKANSNLGNFITKGQSHSESYENKDLEIKCTSEIQPMNDKLKLIKQRLSKGKLLKNQNSFNNNTKNVTIIFGNDKINNKKGVVNIEVDEESSKIPEEIQINLQKLISKYPHGLLCSQLPSEYEKLYKKELNFEKYGFASLIRLCMTLENIFHWEKESTFDFKLYDRRKPIPKIKICFNDNPLETSPNKPQEIDPLSIIVTESNDWDEYFEFIPADAFKLGKQILNSCVNDFNIGDRVPVVVSAISDPGKFWLYKDDGVLDKMMNTMQSYYRDNKAKYLVPEFLLEVGLYCVVHKLDEFQRGLIVDLLSNLGGYVKVYFIDYGTLENIPREKIWFLNEEFSILPAYAIRGKLSDIEPLKGVWNKQSTLKFRDFVSGKHVFARISMIEEQLITVHIADFRSPLKFLNDVLVEEGFASYITKPIQKEPAATPGYKRDISKLLDRIKMRKMIINSTLEDKDS